MEQGQHTALLQGQRVKISPRLYHSLKLMTLSVQELTLRIRQEMETNPALDIVSDPSFLSLESVLSPTEVELPEDNWDPHQSERYDQEKSDRIHGFIEGTLTRPESLHEHLLWQLQLQPILAPLFRIGELIIHNLDDNGFHREDPDTLTEPRQRPLVHHMIQLIQRFEPVGTCVADSREALIVQARIDNSLPMYTEEIIQHHLTDLEQGRHRQIALALHIDEADIDTALRYIRGLDPFPGRKYANETVRYVIPDVQFKVVSGEVIIVMNEEEIPVLGINAFYNEMSRQEDENQAAVRFAKQHIRDAHWFINSIHRRNQTLRRTAMVIARLQHDFFLYGPKRLVPLTLKDVAEEIGVHVTTVSRIATSKYAQTEWGTYELKYFFSGAIPSRYDRGGSLSREAVKETMREILAHNNDKRMSDRQISNTLRELGITIARRTVAKYRSELQIDSSYNRI